MQNNVTETKPVRIWEVIAQSDYIPELEDYRLFSLEGKTATENPGVKRDRDEVLIYNVSDAPQGFKEAHADIIHEIEINTIRDINGKEVNNIDALKTAKKKTMEVGQIVSILSFNIYETLSQEDQKAIGKDQVMVVSTDDGYRLESFYRTRLNTQELREIKPSIYFIVRTGKLAPELLDKISSDIQEFQYTGNNLFERKGAISQDGKGTL